MKVYKIHGDSVNYLVAVDSKNSTIYRYDDRNDEDVTHMEKSYLEDGMELDNWEKITPSEGKSFAQLKDEQIWQHEIMAVWNGLN